MCQTRPAYFPPYMLGLSFLFIITISPLLSNAQSKWKCSSSQAFFATKNSAQTNECAIISNADLDNLSHFRLSLQFRINNPAIGDFNVMIGAKPEASHRCCNASLCCVMPHGKYCAVNLYPKGSDSFPDTITCRTQEGDTQEQNGNTIVAKADSIVSGGSKHWHSLVLEYASDNRIRVVVDGKDHMLAELPSQLFGSVKFRFWAGGAVQNVRIERRNDPDSHRAVHVSIFRENSGEKRVFVRVSDGSATKADTSTTKGTIFSLSNMNTIYYSGPRKCLEGGSRCDLAVVPSIADIQTLSLVKTAVVSSVKFDKAPQSITYSFPSDEQASHGPKWEGTFCKTFTANSGNFGENSKKLAPVFIGCLGEELGSLTRVLVDTIANTLNQNVNGTIFH